MAREIQPRSFKCLVGHLCFKYYGTRGKLEPRVGINMTKLRRIPNNIIAYKRIDSVTTVLTLVITWLYASYEKKIKIFCFTFIIFSLESLSFIFGVLKMLNDKF